ncbi:MAG: hypothetical protein EHM93_02195 [Bacteroidales bacterium]|nr:MAG: hypothetical protein EHM93_02195 [Bacteroidales bacterium]
MKRFVIALTLLLVLSFTLVKCKLDSKNSIKQVVDLELTNWILPNEAVVSTPFNLVLSSQTESTCYGKIVFVNENYQGKDYIYAQSLFQDNGNGCTSLTVYKDSTISITINQVGKHYYYFRKDREWNKDSIEIIPE